MQSPHCSTYIVVPDRPFENGLDILRIPKRCTSLAAMIGTLAIGVHIEEIL